MSDDDATPPVIQVPDAVVVPDDTRPPSLFERIGGRPVVESIIARLYDGIEADPALRPLFPDDLTTGRLRQQWFLEEWLGGERRYTAQRGTPRLRQRHLPFSISGSAAKAWLGHMRAALVGAGVDAAAASEVMGGLQPLADHFVNIDDD